MSKRPPIGFWIRQADNLLTGGIEGIQSSFGLSRTEWQVLSSIYEKENVTVDEVAQLFSPFAAGNKIKEILEGFKTGGLLTEDASPALTDEGIKLYKACLEKQNEFRQKVMAGISEQEYEQVIRTLQTMIENMRKK